MARKCQFITIAGVRYVVQFLPRGHELLRASAAPNGSECHGQTFYRDVQHGPRIVFERGQSDRVLLGTMLHEGLHAIAPRLFDEEWIAERERELTELVYDIGGFRRV